MKRLKTTAGRAVRRKTAQSKAAPRERLKNASRSLVPWRAKARRLGRSRSFAERINCQLATTVQGSLARRVIKRTSCKLGSMDTCPVA